MKNKLRTVWTWIKDRLPIQRGTYRREIDRERARHLAVELQLKEHHRKALTEATQRGRDIVNRLTAIEFDRLKDNQYRISFSFSPRLFDRLPDVDDMRCIAEWVGDRVKYEIATSRFIQQAYDREMDRERRRPCKPWEVGNDRLPC